MVNVYLQIRIYLILFISFVCKKVENNGDNLHNSGTLTGLWHSPHGYFYRALPVSTPRSVGPVLNPHLHIRY